MTPEGDLWGHFHAGWTRIWTHYLELLVNWASSQSLWIRPFADDNCGGLLRSLSIIVCHEVTRLLSISVAEMDRLLRNGELVAGRKGRHVP
jgi:hypothetical protein